MSNGVTVDCTITATATGSSRSAGVDPVDPAEFTFPTVGGRFYRLSVSSDASPEAHRQVWSDNGPATVAVGIAGGVARRFYSLHVMTADGPWPGPAPPS